MQPVEERNAERRQLCAEYARNKERRRAIIARLAELSGEANKEAAAERIGAELERAPQAELIRTMPSEQGEHSHFVTDLQHYRADFCNGPAVEVTP